MKILFMSDSHLYINNRIDDFYKSLEQIGEASKDVDVLWHLGDVYHKRLPHPMEQKMFRTWLKSLKCDKKILVGNHDRNLETNTLNDFEILGGAEIIEPPYILKIDNRKIYLHHTLVEGAKLGPSNLDLNLKNSLPLSELAKQKCNLYVLGHVHKMQAVVKVPLVFYVGSIERIDFGERNEDKYFAILDTKNWKLEWKKLKIRPMQQFEIDLSEEAKDRTLVVEKGAIVKVVLKGTQSQIDKFNEGPLRESLVKTLTYSIQYDVVKEIKIRNEAISETKTIPQSFLEYAKVKELNEYEVKKGLEVISNES